jgi:hypothetical protein
MATVKYQLGGRVRNLRCNGWNSRRRNHMRGFNKLLRQAISSRLNKAQMFWVRCAESLRKLDLSVELGRRDLEETVPKRLACEIAAYISDWLRISFAVFLGSQVKPLMGIRDVGEWKHYAIERFRSILNMTVRNSLKTNSPILDWAARQVMESWNVQ